MDSETGISVGNRVAVRSMAGPTLATLLALVLAALELHHQGRTWWCACGHWWPWAGDIWTSHNSQHFADPYSFTHVLHGVVFCGLVAWTAGRLPWRWRFVLAVSLEALWEAFENTDFVIRRYRETTLALGYTGDTIANSMGDAMFCATGFLIARHLGLRRSILLFLLTDCLLLLWIRDSLLLNVVMLICPIDAIKTWQIGR